jgi:putative ABC transport system substrate-binding protein
MEYRYANNQLDRLPTLAAELVGIPAAVIVTSGGPRPTLVAKAATTTIPIVFAPIPDPVRSGLVASFNRPGGNITGIAALTIELDPKRLELLHELTPSGGPLGVLLNPSRPDLQIQAEGIEAAARSVGRQLVPAYASTGPQIDAAFATLAQQSVAGLLVAADAFFSSQRIPIVVLATRHGWPAIYQWREFADAGGLASYGASLFDSYRQVGLFVARILKGEKPAELPVQQPTKFEFVINLRTARALGLTVPLALLGRADEVIE